jgi:hypothetical protein
MGRVVAIAAGLLVGILLAGLASATLVVLVPPQLRGAPLVWAVAAAIVVGTTTAAWGLWSRSRRKSRA